METQVIETVRNAGMDPFSIKGSLWILWFIIGISVLWLDLVRKIHLGFLSIAAFMTVFASFFMPVYGRSNR